MKQPKLKKPKTTKQNLRVMRIDFTVSTVLKDEVFTDKGNVRYKLRNGIAKYLQFEAHKFIDSQSPRDIFKHATIEVEEVEVEDETDS